MSGNVQAYYEANAGKCKPTKKGIVIAPTGIELSGKESGPVEVIFQVKRASDP
jgi:hypothetical protein